MADRSYVVELDLRKKGDFRLDSGQLTATAAKFDQTAKSARNFESELSRINARANKQIAELAHIRSPEFASALNERFGLEYKRRAELRDLASRPERARADREAAFERTREGFDVMRNSAGGLVSVLDGAVGKVMSIAKWAGVAAGASAIGGLTYGVVGLNAQLESATSSLGTLLRVQGHAASVPAGLAQASTLIEKMRDDAQKLPGEFEDLFNIYLTGAGPALKGMDPEKWRSMASMVMVAAKTSSIDMQQAAREFSILLEGRAGGHNTLGTRAFNLSGARAEEFNKLGSIEERAAALMPLLNKFGEGIPAFANTFDAQSSTFVDNLKRVGQATTAPLFKSVIRGLADINGWFDEHRTSVSRFTNLWGARLVDAFEYGRRKLEEYGPIIVRFAEVTENRVVAAWAKIAPYASAFEASIKRALEDPNGTIDRLTRLGEMYLALKGGSMLLGPALGAGMQSGLAAGATNLATRAGAGLFVAGAVESAATGPNARTQAETIGGGALAGLAGGPFGALVGAGVGALMSGVQSLRAWQDLRTQNERFAAEHADREVRMRKDAADKIGMGQEELTRSYHREAERLSSAGYEVEAAALRMAAAMQATSESVHGLGARISDKIADDAGYAYSMGMIQQLREKFGPGDGLKTPATPKHPGGGGGTNIQKVEIVVTSNQNPSRIALAVTGELDKLGRNPSASKYVRDYSAVEAS